MRPQKAPQQYGAAVAGASVVIKGSSRGTLTDNAGHYALEGVEDGDLLEISFLGMLPQTVKVGAGRTSVDVVLSEDMIGLEDVVVTGYTTMKRKDITGSVSSISADRIERIPAYNITTALTGIAGIRMDGGSIRIRGTRSRNASNDPLIVLDGIPYDETLASINPGDIESIDVLKDASSTAIYGARGANGVILITTKQARQGKTTVTYDGFVGAGVNNWGSLDVMDADEYIAFQREASRAAGTWHSEADDAKAFFGIELANMGKVDNDWMGKYFNKKRLWTSHSLTISAATDKSAYKIAFNYKNEDSRYKNAGHDHFYLTADLSHKVLPFLKVGLSSRAYYIVKNDKPDMFNQFLHMSPLTQTRNEDGSYNVYPFGDPFVKNPYMNESDDVYKDKTEEWKLFLRFFAQIDLAKGLTFNTNFAYSPAFSSRGYYYDNRSVSYTDERNVAFMHNNRKADWVWNNVLNYKRQFGRHNIDLTAVYEMQNRQTVNASMSGKDQESPAYLWYNMGRLTDSKSLSSGFVRSQMVSVVGRVQYSYDDRYIITASFREDGASQLSPGHKWAFFPSGAIAWRISEEPFLKDVEWISNLKLRASYGMTGNYSIAAYATAGTLHGKYANFNGGELHRPGLEPETRPTPDLEWERNKMLDIGLDFGFLGGRINGSVDWYLRQTDDLLNNVITPMGSNFGNTVLTNIGSMENKGVEFNLNFIPVQTKDWNLTVGFNGTFQHTEFTKLNNTDDPDYAIQVSSITKGTGNLLQRHMVGYAPYTYYCFQQVYDQDGKPIQNALVDRNKNGQIDQGDRYMTDKSPNPDFFYGISLKLSYKNWDFGFNGHGSAGNWVFNDFASANSTSNIDINAGNLPNFARLVKKTGFTKANSGEQWYSDMFLENASFFRMDDINLGYTFNKIGNWKGSMRVAFGVQNVFVITDYSGVDPEIPGVNGIDGSIWPRPRTYSLRLNVNF